MYLGHIYKDIIDTTKCLVPHMNILTTNDYTAFMKKQTERNKQLMLNIKETQKKKLKELTEKRFRDVGFGYNKSCIQRFFCLNHSQYVSAKLSTSTITSPYCFEKGSTSAHDCHPAN